MKNVTVRCWEVTAYRPGEYKEDKLFITYPEGNMGHSLIVCTNCGTTYAIDISKEVYVGPPLTEKLKTTKCLTCDLLLVNNFAYYPDNYRIEDGRILKFDRSLEIPPDDQSILKEFPGIYD